MAGCCVLCGTAQAASGLCAGCGADLPWRGRGARHRRLPFVQRVVAPLDYAFPVDALVQAIKFHRDLAALRVVQHLFASEVSNYLQPVELIVPVPLGPQRYRSRGFNPASMLAQALGTCGDRPVAHDLVVRRKDRAPQSGLPAAARRGNVRGAFALNRIPAAARVLVVDDVVTTGATLVEMARVLRAGGVRVVEAAALAASRAA